MAEQDFNQPRKEIDGYFAGKKQKRPLAFRPYFGDVDTTWKDTVDYDREDPERNLMGQFAAPDVDVYRVQLPGHDTVSLNFAYSKEAVGSPDYEEITQRMLGEQPGNVTLESGRLARAVAVNMREQFRKAYERFENLYEFARANILINGVLDTVTVTPNGQHKRIVWNMGRTILTNGAVNNQAERDAADNYLDTELVPEVNLTTLWANTSTAVAGGRSWDAIDGNTGNTVTPAAGVSPVRDLQRMLTVAADGSGTAAIYISDDAYSWLRADLITNYKDAADITIRTKGPQIALDVIPYIEEIEGITFRGLWDGGNGIQVPMYTYNGKYTDRIDGTKKAYMGSGKVLLIPPASEGAIRYGKIMHRKARWAAKQFWVNQWEDKKTGVENYEIHTNFVAYHKDINSVVCWTVCSTAKR